MRILLIAIITAFLSTAVLFSADIDSEKRIDALIAAMSLDEKVGQMLTVERAALSNEQDIADYNLGGLFSEAGSAPYDNSAAGWSEMISNYQAYALKTRFSIPLLYGTDAVHGNNNVLGSTLFPHNIGIGCTRNPSLAEKAARVTALEARGAGINWVFGPESGISSTIRWGGTYEHYSEEPKLVAELAVAQVKGFQGSSLSNPASVLACARHYIADGAVGKSLWQQMWGMDGKNASLDEKDLRKDYLEPYQAVVHAGVMSVMLSPTKWNGMRIHRHRYLITDVLKGELGFKGIVASSYMGVPSMGGNYMKNMERAVNAGVDVIIAGRDYKYAHFVIKYLTGRWKIKMSRIDDAVRRILRVKLAMGLLDKPPVNNPALTAAVGSKEHREVARQCVRESIVLLKNEKSLLPLSKKIKKLIIGGRTSHSIGLQCGGWTVDWLGSATDDTRKTPPGTTFYKAVLNTLPQDAEVYLSVDGRGAEGYDAGIFVFGENPYAGPVGDRFNLALDDEELSALELMRKSGIPVVVVLITGRPVLINKNINLCDAIVAAFLPGTEGQGVVDVLFGDYPFTGKLSYSWPEVMSQAGLKQGDKAYKALYPFGYGLSR